MKKFIVARAGKTLDGREITVDHIDQMAASYNPELYRARIWLEHFHGLMPDGPFQAYGDVLSVVAGNDANGRRVLFAELDPTPALKKIVKARQKLSSSIEMHPNFPETGGAYLVGLAVTDNPASLGTSQLNFSAAPEDKQFSRYIDSDIRFDDAPEDKPSILETVKTRFRRQSEKGDTSGETLERRFGENESTIAELARKALETDTIAQTCARELAEIKTELADLRDRYARIDATPAPGTPARPSATGGRYFPLTDC